MFDDVKKEPEDMFEQTDKSAPQVTAPTDQPVVSSESPSAPASVMASSTPPQASGAGSMGGRIAELSPDKSGHTWKTILLVVGIIVIVVASFFLSMRILGSRTSVTPVSPTAVTTEEPIVEEAEEVVEEPVVEEVEEEPASRLDTDKDGLTDEEEAEYGTSIRAADTDSDGLFDREEIMTWGTDPLNPDTDGDGYLDGEEVKGGYNPNGEGLLRDVPSESS
ncbi:hypothetical protein COV05_02990 [Candidatus Uhrbacteria bacterium CG10_big_fil_rev_8_21_14_0_10_48_16]|uniref:EF-hand domain-containing protein n=1 Tax=Candidatus Uhrbacteria bacterium CG10_big_fil_rev_8_21_14_0_10_48_16 TaxID=1975038 RepID=A0A2M8LGY7_9BACT|nr:MAG: hypothetical protein COV05_02990 [Candidatus Uhrbacteria bacterium CG10_big_fil_rev_8_21_14_0_10_48_16]